MAATIARWDSSRCEEAAIAEDEAAKADSAAFAAIVNERCHTLGGILAKMSVLKGEAAEVEMSTELFDAIVRDLERMTGVEISTAALAIVEGPVVVPKREQIDQLQRLVTGAAAPLPSVIELLGITDTDVHLSTVRELIRSVNDRMAEVADATARLRLDKVQEAPSDLEHLAGKDAEPEPRPAA